MCNIQTFSFLLGLDKRSHEDPRLATLILDKGITNTTQKYVKGLKALQLARDVACTFLQGEQRNDSDVAILQEAEAEVESADDTGNNRSGEDGEGENNGDRNDGGKKGLGGGAAQRVQAWKREQLSFARAASTWISAKDAIVIKNFKGEDGADSAVGWLERAYTLVFHKSLENAKSQNLSAAQRRAGNANPRHSNKCNLANVGPRQVPHVPLWAHPYRFDATAIYEFVSIATRPAIAQP